MKTKKLFNALLVILAVVSAGNKAMAQCATPSMTSAVYVTGGSMKVCPGDTRSYYVYNTAGYTYTWTPPTGAVITGGQGTYQINITFNAGFTASGVLSVYRTNGCGSSSAPRNYTIGYNAPATPGMVTGSVSEVCAGTSHAYSVPSVAGMTYNWSSDVPTVSYPAGQGTNSVTADFNGSFTSGYLYISATNGCGTGNIRKQKISSVLGMPGAVTGAGNYGQCGQTYQYYSVAPVAGASAYNWYTSGGSNINGPYCYNYVYVDFNDPFTSTTLYVSAVNACGAGAPRYYTVKGMPATPASVTGNTSVCNGGVEMYNAAAPNGASSYTWMVPAGATILGSATGSSIMVHWGATGGMVRARANNDCGYSGFKNLTVAVTCREGGLSNFSDDMISAYPNPAENTLNISAAVPSDDYKISLVNVMGQVVFEKTVTASDNNLDEQLDISNLPSGIYLVNLQSGTVNKTLKIQKQ